MKIKIPKIRIPEKYQKLKKILIWAFAFIVLLQIAYFVVDYYQTQELMKKLAKEKEVEPPKKSKLNLKIGIIAGALVFVIILVVIWYNKTVKQPEENQSQIPITAPIDSAKTKGADSVIYADTNKVSENKDDGETVYEKDDMKILETERGYFIEFGEFENQFILAKKIKELKDKNITPGYEEVKEDGRQYYKMKIGPYQSLKEAKSIMSKL